MFLSFKNKLIQVYIRIRNLLPGQKYFIFKILLYIPLYILLLPIILLIRLIRPFILIRFGELMSSRIGHLAANTELYLCEKEASINRPNIFYIDIFYTSHLPICNDYLLNKFKFKCYLHRQLEKYLIALENKQTSLIRLNSAIYF